MELTRQEVFRTGPANQSSSSSSSLVTKKEATADERLERLSGNGKYQLYRVYNYYAMLVVGKNVQFLLGEAMVLSFIGNQHRHVIKIVLN